jgi:RimJ/RimL family protein N-acetyltransferase
VKTTARLRFRRPQAEDAQFYWEIENDPEVKKYLGGPSGRPETLYRELLGKLDDDCSFLTIELLQGSEAIGRGGVITDGNEAEIHFILKKQFRDQKFGSEIGFALRDISSEKFPKKLLVAKVHPENGGSIAILHKLGMTHTGLVSSKGYDNGFLRFTTDESLRSL